MHLDVLVALAGLVVGFVVGLTGMGGGALMTPILVLVFGVQPLAAVSSDLVASVVMKPIGGSVHLRRGTVNLGLVGLLALGSVPSAFVGALLLSWIDTGEVQTFIRTTLGLALLIAALAMVVKGVLQARRSRGRAGIERVTRVAPRPIPTVLVGVVGGLVVGMTSVGSGSLMIVMLMLLYPRLSTAELVGTDLVQAVPLVLSAALGHLFYGDLRLGLTASLLLGAIPGVYLGAHASVRAPDQIVRPVLMVVLTISALKLLGAADAVVLGLLGAGAASGVVHVAAGRVRAARAAAAPEPSIDAAA